MSGKLTFKNGSADNDIFRKLIKFGIVPITSGQSLLVFLTESVQETLIKFLMYERDFESYVSRSWEL